MTIPPSLGDVVAFWRGGDPVRGEGPGLVAVMARVVGVAHRRDPASGVIDLMVAFPGGDPVMVRQVSYSSTPTLGRWTWAEQPAPP